MRIGIDVSQMAYKETGVANYLSNLIYGMVKNEEHEYVLFFSSMRRKFQIPNSKLQTKSNIQIRKFKIPPTLLDFFWNKLHVLPIESLIGDVDVFITSDWTEPPVKKAKKATILYDLLVYKYPKEMDKKIVRVQQRKLDWVKKECNIVFCISESTKRDAMELLNIPQNKLKVIYPGLQL